MHKINNQKDTLEAKVNKNKLAKNKKDGKWLFFMSLCAWLLCALLSSKFNSELLPYAAFFFFIVQIGSVFLWDKILIIVRGFRQEIV